MLKSFDTDEVRWTCWEGSSLLYRPITTSTKEWHDYLSPADARRIEDFLLPEMIRFGYQRHAPVAPPSTSP
jgi:hypothetical protein